MYIMTYQDQVITLEDLNAIEQIPPSNDSTASSEGFLAAKTRRQVMNLYTWHIGYPWSESNKELSIKKYEGIK